MRYLLYSAMLAAALCFPAGPAAAACDQFTPFGQPVSSNLLEDVGVAAAPDRIVICHTGQVVAFNPERNVSDWVAYRVRREDLLDTKVERKDNFRPDPQVPERHRVVHSDYTRTGYDRGHLAPAAAMRWSFDAMNDSFFMTNIAPQVGSGFNQLIWKSLERRMRHVASKCICPVLVAHHMSASVVAVCPVGKWSGAERLSTCPQGAGRSRRRRLTRPAGLGFRWARRWRCSGRGIGARGRGRGFPSGYSWTRTLALT